jgi:hypothetical protein
VPVIHAGATTTNSQGVAYSQAPWRPLALVNTHAQRPASPHVGSTIECTSYAIEGESNVNLDCNDVLPNNESDIYVDPNDPDHMISSSNDYASCCDEFYTTFDGGQSWVNGDMSYEDSNRIGSDPVSVISPIDGMLALHASLNFNGDGSDGDVVISPSTDGGITWDDPIVVGPGKGFQVFNDKEWITVDTHPSSPYYGRFYLVWAGFHQGHGGLTYKSSPIYESHSDDGFSWSAPQLISGHNADLCPYQTEGSAGACDENEFAVPTVGPDGTIYVGFENSQNSSTWEAGEVFEDQYLVVRSHDGGATWSSPNQAVALEDGSLDYPINVDGRQTATGLQVRLNSAGNIIANETGQLYIVFSDNRNGRHDVADPVTNLNVFIVKSTDGGTTWGAPVPVTKAPSDQWFPWADVRASDNQIGVVYFDRSWTASSAYNATYAYGNLVSGFTTVRASTADSRPKDSLFFQAGIVGCEKCAVFNGDYNRMMYGSDGSANLTWTDMRDVIHLSGEVGHGEHIGFVRI